MHSGEGIVYPLPDFISGKPNIFRPEADILFHNGRNNLIIRILKDHSHFSSYRENVLLLPTVHSRNQNRTFRRKLQGIEKLRQSRFSGSVMSQNADETPFLYRKIERGKSRQGFNHLIIFISPRVLIGHIFYNNIFQSTLLLSKPIDLHYTLTLYDEKISRNIRMSLITDRINYPQFALATFYNR